MRAIVVRHYRTLCNATDRIMGWADSPIADDGYSGIEYVAHRLQELDIEIDAVYSSTLERSRNSARYFADRFGLDRVHDCAELSEVNYGQLSHRSKKWVARHVPEYKRDPDFVFPQGESFRRMQRRSVEFCYRLAETHADQTLLMVLHAGVIRGLVSDILGLDYAQQLRRKVSHQYIGEFLFEGRRCRRYDELGKESGFVTDGVVKLPRTCV